MTARLGKAVREGSRAEPATRGSNMHILLKTQIFAWKMVPDAFPGLFLGARFDFWVCFNDSFYTLDGFLGG